MKKISDFIKIKKKDNLSLTQINEEKERSISLPAIYEQIQKQISYDAWLIDVYIDESEIYAIFSDNGKLYRAIVTLSPSDNLATVQDRTEWIEVMHDFVPVQQSLQIRSQEDGTYRWLLIAGTSILNRNGEIDSSKLFDSMIDYAERTKDYPYLTFLHLGEDFKMGSCDYLARDGVALIASGIFEEENKIAKAMLRAYQEDSDYWGSSIGFIAYEYDMQEVAPNVKLPVYTDGILREISILPEEIACALGTSLRAIKEKNVMNQKIREALEKLAGDDKDLLSEFESMVDNVNRTVETENLIHRKVDEKEEKKEEEEESDKQDVQEQDKKEVVQTMEIDETVMQTLVDRAISSESFTNSLKTMQDDLNNQVKRMEEIQKEITDIHGALIKTEKSLMEKFELLQRSDDEKRREWEQDLSEKTINKIKVTYRPLQSVQNDSDDSNLSMADIAQSTLANLK